MPTPVSFRLSDEALTILLLHAENLKTIYHRDVDRTEALEDIIQKFLNKEKTFLSKIRKKLQPSGDSGLDTFLAATRELQHEQLEEALH
jgi:hypothetical protein